MKILSCRFKNLNSLKGESPVIELEDGILGDAGIFAITGPTGAGKTTILDAICVALYGMTPRLGSGSEIGEIMTRHTGECWSEVEFAVNGKRYRSRWDLRRAHGKAAGKMQQATMELIDLNGLKPTILEAKKSLVPKMVADLTGLDATRFFRSMMLAQGNFAAFLMARENERAELLEKMTGTEIYAEVSRLVYERHSSEKQKLERLQAERDAAELLDDVDLHQLTLRHGELEKQTKTVNEELIACRDQKSWLERIASLRQQIERATTELKQIAEQEQVAKTDLEKLRQHQRALPLKEQLTLLSSQRHQAAHYEEQIQKHAAELERIARERADQESEVAKLEQKLKAIQESQAETEKLLPELIRRDEQIASKLPSIRELETRNSAQKSELAELETKLKQQHSELESAQTALKSSSRYISEHAEDEVLLRELSLLKAQLQELPKSRSAADQAAAAQKEADAAFRRLSKEQAGAQGELKQLAADVEAAKTRRSELEGSYRERLDGQTIADWEARQDETQVQSRAMEKLETLAKRHDESVQRRTKTEATQHVVAAELESEAAKRREHEVTLTGLKAALEKLRVKQKQDLLIQKYEADRGELTPGEACPLCGSKEHPWHTGAPTRSDSEQKLKAQQELLDQVEKDLTTSSQAVAAARAKSEQLTEELAEIDADLQSQEEQLTVLQKEAAFDGDRASIVAIQNAVQLKTEAVEELRQRVKGLRVLREELGQATQELGECEKRLSESQLALHKSGEEHAHLKREIVRLGEDAANAALALSKLEESLDEQLRPFGLCTDQPLESIAAQLAVRNETFIGEQKKQQEASRQAEILRRSSKEAEDEVGELSKAVEATASKLKDAEAELRGLREERKRLGGDRSIDEIRTLADAASKQALTDLKAAQTQLQAMNEDAKSHEGLRKHIETELTTLRKEMEDRSTQFAAATEATGFKDEAAVAAALLPAEEVEKIRLYQQGLAESRTREETRHQDGIDRLAKEEIRALTKAGLDEVSQLEEELAGKHTSLHQELGEVRACLKQQEKIRQRLDEQHKQLLVQQKECERWSKLNHLIGSANGDKFRKFAQGLTLDYLIHLANQHLSALNDRYVLRRGEEDELGIEISDSYQADTVRPTSTLSGGESFLVSLALALGLSKLTSRKNNVDSLFLDEGFGTLDTDTLETALAALHNIRTSGKTIGIISHVDALKERIPVQIQVRKLSGGVSQLEIVSE